MAITSVSVPGASDRGRKPTVLENIAMGVDIASKILGTGVDAYKTFGLERQKQKEIEKANEADFAKSFAKATDADIKAGKGEEIAGRPGKYVYRAPGEDPIMAALKLQLLAGQAAGQKTAQKKQEIELKQAEEVSKFGKPLTQNTIETLSSAKLLPKKMAEINQIIETNKDMFGPIEGRAGGFNPYDEKAQTVQSRIKAAAQEVGKYLEGGVLRKEDVPKYEQMLPNLFDTPEVAKNKAAIVQKMLFDKFMSDYEAYKNSGFDTRAFDSSPMKQLAQPEFLKPTNKIEIGTIMDGFRYKGGLESDPNSWEPVK